MRRYLFLLFLLTLACNAGISATNNSELDTILATENARLATSPANTLPATFTPPSNTASTPSPQPLISPSPPPSATPAPLAIQSFNLQTSDLPTATDGKRLAFSWTTTGGIVAFIENGASSTPNFPAQWTVPASGTLTVELPNTLQHNPSFSLILYDATDLTLASVISQTVQAEWACQQTSFFEPPPLYCPQQPPLEGWAAQQQFERGKMVWLNEVAEDGGFVRRTIYTLYNEEIDGIMWQAFNDTWDINQPINNPNITPPTGLLQPERSFGKLWRENEYVRGRLGWATSFEQGYRAQWQSVPLDLPAQEFYMSTFGGGVLQLTGDGNITQNGTGWTPFEAIIPPPQ